MSSAIRYAFRYASLLALLLTMMVGLTPPPAYAHQTPRGNRAIAADMVGPEQFYCLNRLWDNESGWDHRARNPYSGAYGIPQSLPASKMASAGSDWRTNPHTQIRWGLSYIRERYGSPCRAWNYWQRNGWY